MHKLLSNGDIIKSTISNSVPAWLGLAFRPLFLFAAIFSVASISVWISFLKGWLLISPFGGALWWHQHEMLFGFVTAILVGFLLTAVKTWTGCKGVSGYKLLLLVVLWLAARIAILFPSFFTSWLISALDILFLPVSAFILAIPIVKVKMWRNLIFLPILATMAYTNAMMHCAVYLNDAKYTQVASTSMVLLTAFVMCFMAGRIFPMFTANGTRTPRVTSIVSLEIASLFSLFLITVLSIFQLSINKDLTTVLYCTCAILLLIRGLRWRIWVTFSTPLVWSLHVSYLFIPLGLIALGLSETTALTTKSQGIHLLTVGGMGLMILSMISRVSLGHTGRTISVGNIVNLAFVSLVFATLLRTFGHWAGLSYLNSLTSSALFWIIGFGIFIIKYSSVLTSPRIDGKEG